LANRTERDALFFESLAHKLAFDLDQNRLPLTATSLHLTSWQNLMFMMSTIGTLVSLGGLLILYRKYTGLIATLALAKAASASRLLPDNDLSYLISATTVTTPTSFTSIVRYDIPVLDILVCLLLLTALVLLVYYWSKRQTDPLSTFTVYMEVANQTHRLHLPILTLPTASFLYQFQGTSEVPHISVQGLIFPVLTFRNSPLKIIYSPSHWELTLPTQISLTFEALSKQECCVKFWVPLKNIS